LSASASVTETVIQIIEVEDPDAKE